MNLRFDAQRLTLTVGHVDHMEADPCIIHPFVRTWLVDGLTGQLLHHERNAHGHYTHPCDLRIRQIVSPSWGEEVPLDVLDNITKHKPEAMLLFEIMDFPSENIRGERVYPQTLRYIAWGYLKLLDHRRRPNIHRDIAVQLFRYPYERPYLKTLFYMCLPARFASSNHCGSVPANATPLPHGSPNVPMVYSIYLNPQNRMDKYGAALCVRLEPRPELQMGSLADDTRHPREILALEEVLTHVIPQFRKHHSSSGSMHVTPRSTHASSVVVEHTIISEDPGPLLLCSRRRGEPCAPLTDMRYLATLPSATQGCTWISFSSCGKYLVCGVSGGEGCEVIVYDVRHESVRRIAKFRGHHKTIYECTFSPDSGMVLSCSADGTTRVWAMPHANKPNALLFPDEDGCVASMAHPCYVYTSVFVFDDAHIATGGFDGLVRIWSVATAAEVRVLERQPSRITRLVFDVTGGRLWCIDGSSVLCVWRLQNAGGDIFSAEKPKTTDMFADKGAVELQVLHGTTVMVQTASDGCATVMDAIGFRVRRRLTAVRNLAREVGILHSTSLSPSSKSAGSSQRQRVRM